MKKLSFISLLLSLCLCLCACGESSAPVQTAQPAEEVPSYADEMLSKYGTIIEFLESGNYSEAISAISSMMPEPETKSVSITPENFFDYYEVKHGESYIERDENGNIISIAPAANTFYFELKDCWEMTEPESSYVEIGYTYAYAVYPVTSVDPASGEYSISNAQNTYLRDLILQQLGDPVLSGSVGGFDVLFPELIETACTSDGSYLFCNIEVSHPDDYSVFIPINFTITRAEGSIVVTSR